MPLGDSTQEHVGQEAPTLNDLPWNTHNSIREWMGHSPNEEFFGEWLVYFYDVLSQGQRRALRKTKLEELDRKNFPNPPSH